MEYKIRTLEDVFRFDVLSWMEIEVLIRCWVLTYFGSFISLLLNSMEFVSSMYVVRLFIMQCRWLAGRGHIPSLLTMYQASLSPAKFPPTDQMNLLLAMAMEARLMLSSTTQFSG